MKKLTIIAYGSIILLLSMCSKKNESEPNFPSTHSISNQELSGQTSYNSTTPITTLFYGNYSSGSPVSNDINSIVVQYGLNENASNRISLGLALFYTESYQGNTTQVPRGIVHYYFTNNVLSAQYWDILATDTIVKDTTLGGLTTFVSKLDLFRINDVKALNAQEIVILLNAGMLPSTVYHSAFQAQIDYRYIVGGDGTYTPRSCNRTGDCAETYEGTCTFQEHQSGGESTICIPSHCAARPVAEMQSQAGYPETPNEISALYKIRDEFLLKTPKGRQYIDNYYYCSKIAIGGINFTTAQKMYALYEIGFFDKLSHFDDPSYDNEIFITSSEKPLLIDVLNHAETISSDARYQSIVTGIKNDIVNYENKTFSYVKNDF